MGYLLIVVEKQLAAAATQCRPGAQPGDRYTRFIDPDEIKALEPALNTQGLVGGAYDPEGGYIDVTRIVLSFLTAAQENGVRLISGLRAEAVETEGGRVAGVSTQDGLIEAPVIINATGSWSGELLAPLGVDLPMEPRRLDTMYLRQPPGRVADRLLHHRRQLERGHPARHGARHSHRRLSARNAVGDGSRSEANNEQGDAEHLARIRTSLAERLPDFCDAEPIRSVSRHL